jgi:hypothetical protein
MAARETVVTLFTDARVELLATRNTHDDNAWSCRITLLSLGIEETSSFENLSSTDAIEVIAGNSFLANTSIHWCGVNFDFSSMNNYLKFIDKVNMIFVNCYWLQKILTFTYCYTD